MTELVAYARDSREVSVLFAEWNLQFTYFFSSFSLAPSDWCFMVPQRAFGATLQVAAVWQSPQRILVPGRNLTLELLPLGRKSPRATVAQHRRDTPLASSDGEGATSDLHMRRVNVSPRGSGHSYDSYFEENSLEETAEVEAALNDIDREFESTEDMLTQWSRGSSSAGLTYTGTTPSYSTSLDTYSIDNRDGIRLSTISERTENIPLRPTSHGARIVTEAHRLSAHRINTASPSPAHTRSQTDFVADRAPGRRTGDLIAFFEDRASTLSESSFGHTRTSSMPAYRSHSPFHPVGQSTPTWAPQLGMVLLHATVPAN